MRHWEWEEIIKCLEIHACLMSTLVYGNSTAAVIVIFLYMDRV